MTSEEIVIVMITTANEKKRDGLNYYLSLQFGQHIRKRLGE